MTEIPPTATPSPELTIQGLRMERDRYRSLLEEARTIVAITADPNSRAPGRAAVARELLKRIDEQLA